jgi:AraC-like DNA-binding protein
MNIIQFTVPIMQADSIIVCDDIGPYFYNYFHQHKEIQLTCINKGEGTLIVGNTIHPFKAGDLFIIGANQPHIIKAAPEYFDNKKQENVHATHVLFDYRTLLNSLMDVPEMKGIKKFLESTQNGLKIPPSCLAAVNKRIQKIKKASSLRRLLSFFKLLHYLANNAKDRKSLTTESSGFTYSKAEGARINYVIKYTLEHYAEAITLERIASVANMTPQAFCKYFKKHTLKTYVTFLNDIRISEACKIIMSGNFDGISSIAYATGFNSAINFNRVFKKVTGSSPSEYIIKHTHKLGQLAKGPQEFLKSA